MFPQSGQTFWDTWTFCPFERSRLKLLSAFLCVPNLFSFLFYIILIFYSAHLIKSRMLDTMESSKKYNCRAQHSLHSHQPFHSNWHLKALPHKPGSHKQSSQLPPLQWHIQLSKFKVPSNLTVPFPAHSRLPPLIILNFKYSDLTIEGANHKGREV